MGAAIARTIPMGCDCIRLLHVRQCLESCMAETDRHLLVVGASGVIGAAAVEHFAARPGWAVTGLSRREPVVRDESAFRHLALDLSDRAACAAGLKALPPVTHLIYAAVREAPGLVSGWGDEELIGVNGRMFSNILDATLARAGLQHLNLLQGVKAYGAHRHAVETPLRESEPRDAHANFYWLQEDHTKRRANECGFAWTIFRPQVLLGAAPGAAMNPVAAIGAYAALCRELALPFSYPGASGALLELVDADLLAEAFEWAALNPAAAGQTFNIANGDVFAPGQAWQHLAASLGLSGEGNALPSGLARFFDEEGSLTAWARLAEKCDLRVRSLPELLGQSHHYLDLLLGARIANKPLPVLLSAIKLRQAGFASCRDSVLSLHHWLQRMVDLRLLPPLFEGAQA